jgi:hypothetical protein
MKEEGFNEILLYTTPNGNVKVEIYLQNETVWLTQQKIDDLFGVERSVVTKHLGNILKPKSSTRIQYVQFLHILLLMAKFTLQNSIIWMPSFLLVTGLKARRQRISVSGPQSV